MKVFISQPMKNRTNEEIEIERKKIVDLIKKHFSSAEIIDSFMKDAPVNANPLWYLSKSIEFLSQADLAVFAEGYEAARGCSIEHSCAKEYGIKILYFKNKSTIKKVE
jgi:hypothetical protein